VDRKLASSRNEAQDLVARKRVLVSGAVAEKASRMVSRAEPVIVTEPRRFVSRGGEKLDSALDGFAISVEGKSCLDAGASTGGFTDCLIQRGARRIWSIDVGHGQLASELRGDPRVVLFERCNLRHASLESLSAEPFDILVADLSFISLTVVAETLSIELASPGADMVVLVKPQFEAGRKDVDRGSGVIRDPAIWRAALIRVGSAFESMGAAIMGVMASPLLGPAGNVEFLMHALAPSPTGLPTQTTSLNQIADRVLSAIDVRAGI
jgi:23S rRNA (cytidine1920-2'-O)/16S rRNA (cytidine1409-2'-O)-methyltransferase